jgi:MSHA biogenesis protein MshN
MSLVNKMLRDLDARRASEAERGALPSAVTPLAARHKSTPDWSKRAALLFFFIAVAALGMWQWQKFPSLANVTVPHANPALPNPTKTSSNLPAPAPSSATQSAAVSVPRPAAPPPPITITTASPAKAASAEKTAVPLAEKLVAEIPEKPVTRSAKAPVVASETKVIKAIDNSAPPNLILPPSPANMAKPTDTPRIEKQERIPTATEKADALYQSGHDAQRAGRLDDALAYYQAALATSPEQAAARQALAQLLINSQQWEAAEKVLRDGIEFPASRMASTLTLARLLVERNQMAAALDLLQKHMASGERSAEYQGFLAVLLNRAGRAHEAAERYQAATKLAPSEARWWAGLGIALEADGQSAAAQEAYIKARSLPGLPPELAAHVEQKLR